MSIASRQCHPKQPNPSARHEVKAQALRDKNRVFTISNLGTQHERGNMVPAPFNLTQGHRDLGLIPKNRKHGQRLGRGGILKGAFGKVTKTERRRRNDERRVSLTRPV